MTEIKAQKFDIVLPPSDGTPLDETKKGTLNMKIRYVPSVSGGPPIPEESKDEPMMEPPKIQAPIQATNQ